MHSIRTLIQTSNVIRSNFHYFIGAIILHFAILHQRQCHRHRTLTSRIHIFLELFGVLIGVGFLKIKSALLGVDQIDLALSEFLQICIIYLNTSRCLYRSKSCIFSLLCERRCAVIAASGEQCQSHNADQQKGGHFLELSAMRECGEYHITVKGGKYLEALAKADTIVFDKTGTLTRATPQVVQVVPFSGCEEQEVLQLAACLEEHFPHSMANAVVRAAKERGISHEEMHSEVEYIVAHGIASRVGGKRVVIGSAHFIFEDEGCTIPAGEQAKFDALDPQYSHLYLAASGVLAGVICIADPLRPEAAQVLRQLQKLGITQTVMMTGDSDRTARAIAAQVGVDRCFAEVLPEDKAAFVRDAKAEEHTVVMIGDGINDSPALSAADIGIAIHSGAAIAREIADVTIRADSLEELVTLKAIANALQKRVGSNYRFVLSFNSALILLGALGILPPATSAMLHNLSTLGISLRSMTDLLEQKPSL